MLTVDGFEISKLTVTDEEETDPSVAKSHPDNSAVALTFSKFFSIVIIAIKTLKTKVYIIKS